MDACNVPSFSFLEGTPSPLQSQVRNNEEGDREEESRGRDHYLRRHWATNNSGQSCRLGRTASPFSAMVSWLGYCCYVPLLRFLIQYTYTTAERTSQRLSTRLAFVDLSFAYIAPVNERQHFKRRYSNHLWGSSVDDNGGRESGSLFKIPYTTKLLTAVRDLSIASSPEYGKDLANLFAEELHQLRGRDIAEAMFLAGTTV